MDLPVMPPVGPMLAKAVPAIPEGDYVFEPKWDGFRSIVFRDGDEVEIGSRNERPMTRYFPELVTAIRAELPERCVIDGEIVIPDAAGRRLDFEALQLRIHPAATRGDRLRGEPRPPRPGPGIRGPGAAHPPGGKPGGTALGADPGPLHGVRPARAGRRGLHGAAVHRAAFGAGEGAGGSAGPHPPDPGDHRPFGGSGVVQPIRGGRPGRAD